MNDLDDLPARLRSQMHAATAADLAPPDLLERVHRGAARRRRRSVGGLAVAASAVGLAVVALPAPEPSSEPGRLAAPPPRTGELSVVRSDNGQLSVEVMSTDGVLRTERVGLPGFVRNNGDVPVTVLAMSVPGTELRAELAQQPVLVPGGRLPLTLTRQVDCDAEPAVPALVDLRVDVRAPSGSTSLLLPLPPEVVALYRDAHACSEQRRAADDAEARAAQEAQRQAQEARRQAEQ